MNKDEWLSRVQQGHVLYEVTSSAQTLVRVRERKSGRIWYANETGPSNVRCVNDRTGFSHDMSRHLIPEEPRDGDEYDRIWDAYGYPAITDRIT